MWVGSFLLDEEWFDSGDRSLASERCSSVLGGFGVDGVFFIFFIYPLTFIELTDLFVSYAYPFFFISLCIASQSNSDAFNS